MGKNSNNLHMSSEEFREYGKKLIDWIADYRENIESHPVLSPAEPGMIRERLPVDVPENGEGFDDIISDIDSVLMDGITHWQSPDFYAYFPANSSYESVLGELVSAGLGVQGMLWSTSPACTELETHVMDWLVDAMSLPDKFLSSNRGGGVIEDSASSATLCSILAAREKITGFKCNKYGDSHKLVAYCSEHAHSSIDKAIKIAGIGINNLRKIDCDKNFSMLPEKLEEAIIKDKKDGLIPFYICGTIGSTSSCAVDPIVEIGKISRANDLWLHVDAAYAGPAGICPEYKNMFEGLEYADSYSFNAHKFMLTNFDCNCFYVDNKKSLIDTFSIVPEYLKNTQSDENRVIDYRDWQIPLGRRFRSLKLWFVIRRYGVKGIQEHIRNSVKLAELFADCIDKSKVFYQNARQRLGLVCFRYDGSDDDNRVLLEKVNASGKIFISHTVLDGAYTLRLCTGQLSTTENHIRNAWKLIEETVDNL